MINTPANLLKFLNAARNLAKQGLKEKDILAFAKQEFGEVTDLVRLQINKIFKTKNQPVVGKKDPVFDNTVETIPFDDTGTPFNSRNPQKVYGKPKINQNRDMTPDEFEDFEMDNAKLSVNDEIKKGVDEIMSDTSPAALQKSIEVDNLMLEYPGMSRELAKQIANDPDPARKAQVIAMVEQTIKMGNKGKSGDEIIELFKSGKTGDETLDNSIILNNFDPKGRKPSAKGGRIKMAKGGLPNILGF